MTSVSKNVYIDKLDDIVNKYNNTYHSTIKIKPVDVKSNIYWLQQKENNKDPKFKIGDTVKISKYKNSFEKVYTPNWSEEVFVIKKDEIQSHRHILLRILMEKKLLEPFTKTNCKKKMINKKRKTKNRIKK